jgi:hypothetical protein
MSLAAPHHFDHQPLTLAKAMPPCLLTSRTRICFLDMVSACVQYAQLQLQRLWRSGRRRARGGERVARKRGAAQRAGACAAAAATEQRAAAAGRLIVVVLQHVQPCVVSFAHLYATRGEMRRRAAPGAAGYASTASKHRSDRMLPHPCVQAR